MKHHHVMLGTTFLVNNEKQPLASIAVCDDKFIALNGSKKISRIKLTESDFMSDEKFHQSSQKGIKTSSRIFDTGKFKIQHEGKEWFMTYLDELEIFRMIIKR